MRITLENQILRPREDVFPWLADPKKAMQWQPNVKGGEILIDTPEVVGTTFTEVLEEDGGQLEMVGEITQYIANQVIAFHLESKMHRVEVSYTLEEIDTATRLTVDANIHWKFPLNLLSIFIGSRMKAGIEAQMASEILDLKRFCESG